MERSRSFRDALKSALTGPRGAKTRKYGAMTKGLLHYLCAARDAAFISASAARPQMEEIGHGSPVRTGQTGVQPTSYVGQGSDKGHLGLSYTLPIL